MDGNIADIIDLETYDLNNENFRQRCKTEYEKNGAISFEGFLKPAAIEAIRQEGLANQHLAYYTANNHNIYISSPDPAFPDQHIRNRTVVSSKGCITTDQVPANSYLHTLYNSQLFRSFLCSVLGVSSLHEYADPLSSINLHYASEGQQLGWHYDNSSFAITLLIQKPIGGGVFEYVKDVRNADKGDMNFDLSEKIVEGTFKPSTMDATEGSLVFFKGRNSIHRVTPTEGDRTRMLVVLAYNTEPNISLSESARMTFYGRLG
ncbi:hypothetical protein [Allomuricauda sp. NBRC 101325]|uniref:HalD/BesD family halogenase n=1 Tax=Allomuricauda sp. NBRC 101325 TaxID=1113758 RepID=UPI0024A26C0E|nr:hypothetical protein [Muricauda sp. NBRC 101325]GLU44586.1 hypothetical protein Musp01_22100 [Muricauda sp. NBRC 101325]